MGPHGNFLDRLGGEDRDREVYSRRNDIMRFFRSEDGQGLVEFALVIVLVAVVVIAILALFGPDIGNWINKAAAWLGALFGIGG